MAIKVKLRQKPISGNRLSLYLDFWPAIKDPETGKPTRREFLKLYLYAPVKKKKQDDPDKLIYHKDKSVNAIYKKHNEETLTIAEGIRQKRQNELDKPEVYSEYECEQIKKKKLGEADFLKYYRELANKRTGSSYYNWDVVYDYIVAYGGDKIKFADVTEKFCNGFRDFLLSTKGIKNTKKQIEQNTAVEYFSKFRAALRQAYKDGHLQIDINAKLESIKGLETERTFLTVEELNKLAQTECASPVIKKAALFSALTGLRFSDILKLTWEEIEFIKGQGYLIKFRQKKTKGTQILPISDQAYSLLGEPKQPNERVFEDLHYSAYYNIRLYRWLGAAGITKPVSFHSFRHTFATLQLGAGTDVYTVSKMLGHKNIKTTEVYLHALDKLKRDAADKIKLDHL